MAFKTITETGLSATYLSEWLHLGRGDYQNGADGSADTMAVQVKWVANTGTANSSDKLNIYASLNDSETLVQSIDVAVNDNSNDVEMIIVPGPVNALKVEFERSGTGITNYDLKIDFDVLRERR